MTNALKNYNSQKTNQKLDIILLDKNIEELAFEINHLIEHIVQANVDKKRTENGWFTSSKIKRRAASYDMRMENSKINTK
ncbi:MULTISPECIES: hypothetical protein [Bacillus]|nr:MULTISPECIES: hypothetical protein [Bacillus cereus group]MDF2083664.1 hypothetical protein [Bacillus pseudomycoides]OOG94032.1 hypothetical protein BTH41_03045 [Bacillus mycoides]